MCLPLSSSGACRGDIIPMRLLPQLGYPVGGPRKTFNGILLRKNRKFATADAYLCLSLKPIGPLLKCGSRLLRGDKQPIRTTLFSEDLPGLLGRPSRNVRFGDPERLVKGILPDAAIV